MAFQSYSGNLVSGDFKRTSTLGEGKTSSQGSIANGAKTYILELYMDITNAYTALGFKSSKDNMGHSSTNYDTYSWNTYNDAGPYCKYKSYDFNTKSAGKKIYVSNSSGSNPRKVFAIHTSNTSNSLYPAHLVYGPISSSSTFNSSAYYGFSVGDMDTWVTHTAGNGVIYKSITVNTNDAFIETTLPVIKGNKYTFNMHTVSEANSDGIIISKSKLTSSNVSNGGVARCSGVDVKTNYTYSASSDGTIYIYFKTDISILGESHTVWNTDSKSQETTSFMVYDGFTTGDIEIIVEKIKTKVTFNRGGGTGGTNTIEIPYGTNMNTISIKKPGGKTYCNFAGYYEKNSRTSPGKMYIDSSGKGVSGITWDIPQETYTLHAFYNYTPSIVSKWYTLNCAYCTSSATSVSTLQADTSITLGVIVSPMLPGTFTYTQYNVNASNHLGNLSLSNNKTVTIPVGTASGDYIFNIEYLFTPNDSYVFIKSIKKECQIWIIPTYIVKESINFASYSYLTQKKDIPVGHFVLDKNNLSEYFQYPITIPDTTQITFNNGQTTSSPTQISWSTNVQFIFPSLKKTVTIRQQVPIPGDNSDIYMFIENHEHKEYYSSKSEVIEFISRRLGGTNVYYYSRFSDLGIDILDTEFISDLESVFGIYNEIDVNGLKNIYSVDLLCKYLYVFHNIGSIISNSGVSYWIFAEYNDTKVYREANSVTSLSASVGESSIYAGDKTFIKTKATLKSGYDVSVKGTYSGYDSSIINIDNNVTVICVDNVPDKNDYTLEYSKIYYYYGQYNGNYLFKKMWEEVGTECPVEYIVTDTNDFDVLLHASYNYNGYFTTPTHIVGRLKEDMSDYGYPVDEVKIIDVY